MMADEAPWRDVDTLRELYHDEGLSMHEMADRFGCDYRTVWNWMDRFQISRQTPSKEKPPHFRQHETGYEVWTTRINGSDHTVRVHRLLAVAVFGWDSVVGGEVHARDAVVHHKNGVPWDNRPDNLELMEHGEHTSHHQEARK